MVGSPDSAEGRSVVRVQSTSKSAQPALRVAAALVLAMALAAFDATAAPEPKTPTTAERSDPAEKGLTQDEKKGLAELEQASQFLDQAEKAPSEEEKKRLYEQAATHAERAVQLIPENADAHFVLFGAKGRVAQMGGLASAALALSSLNSQLDEVLRLDPNHSDALAARGGMLMKLPRLMGGNTTEGIEHLERAVEINPNGAGTRLELAEAYEIVGREADALREGREALAIAERKDEPKKVARARTFVTELEKSCDDCTLAAATE